MRAFCLLVMALVATDARADEPTFEALGQAPIAGGDTVRARERALDDALRQAVEQAAATLVDPPTLAARSAQLKLTVYPKARRFVSNYRVIEEGEISGLFQLRVSAQVAVASLAQELQAAPAKLPAAPRARAFVCVGGKGSDGAAVRALAQAVGSRGVEVAASQPCASPRSDKGDDDGVDPDDAQVIHRASVAGASGAVVALLVASPQGLVRGTSLHLANGVAKVRLLSSEGRRAAELEGDGDAWAGEERAAEEAAGRAALDRAVRGLGAPMSKLWPSPSSSGGGVVAHIAGLARWSDWQALVRSLQSIPGVGTVEPRRFSAEGVEAFIHTASGAAALASALGRAPADPTSARFTAEPAGEGELRVRVIAPSPTGAPEERPTPAGPPG